MGVAGPESLNNIGKKRARRGGAPGKLVNVKTDEEQSNRSEQEAEPCSITGADKDQSQDSCGSGGRSDVD